MRVKLYQFSFIFLIVFTAACSKPNNYSNFENEVIREFQVLMSTTNQNHTTPNPQTMASLILQVFSDSSSMRYDVFIDSLKGSSDRITAVELRLGNPVTEGDLLMELPGRYSSAPNATGIYSGLRKSLIDTILNNDIDKYITVKTLKAPDGYIRGQVNNNIIFSANVPLSGQSVNPAVTTTTTGTAYLRLTSDSVLYSKIVLENNELTDPISTVTINSGEANIGGPVFLTLATTPVEVTTNSVVKLTSDQFTAFTKNAFYYNLTSATYPGGKLAGQIKY